MAENSPDRGANDSQFREMADTAPAMLWVTDPSGYCTFLSRGWYEFTGQNEATGLGFGWVDALHPDDRTLSAETFQIANLNKEPFTLDYRLRRFDGEYRWAIDAGRPRSTTDGAFAGYIGSVIDITERKRAEEALMQREEQFRQLTESIQEVFWLTHLDTPHALYVSPAFERVWGRTVQSVGPGLSTWIDTVHPDDRERVRAWVRRRATEPSSEIEYRIVRPNGSIRWIRDRAFWILDAAGQPFRLGGLAEDTTERRELEERLRQAQKMEAVGRLAAGIAHDFNNLLTVIGGYTGLALDALDPELPQAGDLREVAKAARQASALTRQLLAFGRKQVMAPQAVDLNALIEDAERMLRRLIGEDVRLTTRLDPAAGFVRADPAQLHQVLLNLAANARDAMPHGGDLALQTSRTTLESANVPHPELRPGPYAVLTVRDSGRGMTADVRTHLFEPFFTTKHPGGGTGLGLSAVYGIVSQSGGHIEVESEVGNGSTFRLFLPATDAAAATRRSRRAVRTVPGTGTLLVTEDDDRVRSFALAVLRRGGYTVLEAPTAEDALRISTQHQGPIHLAITDVVLPGLSGRELAERLTANRPGIRVLYVSGYTDDEVVRRGVTAGRVPFLPKPFDADSLIERVRLVLGPPRQTPRT